MTIKASGSSLLFGEIVNEFGLPSGRNLGAYRVSQNVGTLTNLPLDAGVPQSGTIKFSDFYSKKLNIVVNYTAIPDLTDRSSTVQLNVHQLITLIILSRFTRSSLFLISLVSIKLLISSIDKVVFCVLLTSSITSVDTSIKYSSLLATNDLLMVSF